MSILTFVMGANPGSWLALGGAAVEESVPSAESPSTESPSTESPGTESHASDFTDGNQLLRKAMRRSASTKFTARVRQSGDLLGQPMVASGLYAQMLDDRGELLTRLQLDCQFDASPGSFLQIHTGSFLWVQRRVGDSKRLSRVDVRRVLSELGRRGRGGDGDADTDSINRLGATLAGGVPAMLASLVEHFEFAETIPSQLRDKPTYTTTGVPRKSPAPAYLPTSVEVVLDRSDLLPYSIVHHHAPADVAIEGCAPGQLRTEFYELAKNAAMDPLSYRFVWDGEEFTDETAAMTQRLRWIVP